MTDPVALWARQQRDARPPSPAALAAAEARLRRRVGRRDAIEYAAGLLALAAFFYVAVATPDWGLRAGCAAIAIGMLMLFANLWRRRPKAPDAFEAASLAFYRAQLVAQRDMLASVWRWYLAPLVPGLLIFLLAIGHVAAQRLPLGAAALVVALGGLPTLGVFWGIDWLNRAAARRLQQRIDALDRGEIA
jgi:hypothetical protein